MKNGYQFKKTNVQYRLRGVSGCCQYAKCSWSIFSEIFKPYKLYLKTFITLN